MRSLLLSYKNLAYHAFCWLICLSAITLEAQSHARPPEGDLSEVDSLIMEASHLAMVNKDSSILLLKNLAYFLEDGGDTEPEELGDVYHALGEIYFMTTESTQSNVYYKKSVKFIEDPVLKAKYTLRIASNYIELGELDSAKLYLDTAVVVTLSNGSDVDKMFMYQTMASYFEGRNQLISALDNLQRAYELIWNKEGYHYAKIAIVRELGTVQKLIGNTEGALDYFKKGLAIAKEKEYKLSTATMNRFAGDIYFQIQDYDTALSYYRPALKQYFANSNRTIQLVVGSNIARIKMRQGKFDQANRLLDSMDVIRKDFDAVVYNYLFAKGDWYKYRTEYDKSRSYYQNLIYESKKDNSYRVVLGAMKEISETYKLEGNDYQSLMFYKKYQFLKDSIFSLNQTNILSDLEAKYQRANQETQIAELSIQNINQSAEITKRERQILWISLLLLAIVIIGLQSLLAYRDKMKHTEELRQTNQTISDTLEKNKTLMKEIHHRVKNNLQVISSLLNLQSRQITDSEAKSAILNSQNRIRSMSIIHQDIYLDEEIKTIDLKLYIENLVRSLVTSFKIKPQEFEFDLSLDQLFVEIDDAIPIGLILNEIISYYIQENTHKGQTNIYVGVENLEDLISVVVKSEGHENGLEFQNNENLGYKIVRSFTAKWKADINALNSATMSGLKVDIPKSKLLGKVTNLRA